MSLDLEVVRGKNGLKVNQNFGYLLLLLEAIRICGAAGLSLMFAILPTQPYFIFSVIPKQLQTSWILYILLIVMELWDKIVNLYHVLFQWGVYIASNAFQINCFLLIRFVN